MAPDGTGLVQLTADDAVDEWPSYSPDGSQIVFSSGRSGVIQVWVMDADGGNPVQRSTGTGGLLGPKFQPLGN
jgi:TolB protein